MAAVRGSKKPGGISARRARPARNGTQAVAKTAKPVARDGAVNGRAMMLAVLQQFRVVVRSVRTHYDFVEARSGVSGAQLWALARIEERPGIKVGELASALAIHQSTASNMLERLVALGLVTKRRVGDDHRVVSVFIAPRGRTALKAAPQPLIGVLQQALSELPPAALQGLHQNLKTVIEAMGVKDVARARGTPLSDM